MFPAQTLIGSRKAETPAERIHWLFVVSSWYRRSPWGKCQTAIGFLGWPLLVLATAPIVTLLNGRRAKAGSGRGLLRQLADQLRLAFAAGLPPPWYYIFDLHDGRLRARAREYVHRYEVKRALYTVIGRAAGTFRDSSLTDKAEFHRQCASSGLPTPKAILSAHEGVVELAPNMSSLPERDLFAKPAWGRGGTGALILINTAPGRWRCGETDMNASELLEHFRRLSRRTPYIVEERLHNHPALADLSCGALATVRVLSILNERGAPEITNAVLRMPARYGSTVDNFHAGGIAAAVKLRAGRLGPATNFDLFGRKGWHERHPATEAPITGRRLPHWSEVLRLALDAHRVFRRFVVVGWDIAILAGGPCLIEGNSSPDLDLIQRPSREPLGNSRFGILFAHHLDQAWSHLAA